METLGDLLAWNAAYHGFRPGFVSSNRTASHAQFFSRISKLADALARLGAQRQDRIAVLAMNELEITEVYGACELSGFIAATINYRLAAQEIRFIVNDAAPEILIYESQFADQLASIRHELKSVKHYICIGKSTAESMQYEDLISCGDASGPPFRSRANDIAHLIYTSGTTGRPKGCMLDHSALLAKFRAHALDMTFAAEDRLLLTMPLFHVGAKGLQGGVHFRGGTAYIHRTFDPVHVLKAIESERITVLHLAPTMVQMLLECSQIDDHDVSSIKVICYAAAPMPVPVLRRGLKRFGPVFHQTYGQTEGPCTALMRHQHALSADVRSSRRLASAGQPISGVQLRIIGDANRDLPKGEVGEIAHKSSMTFRGYWNDSVSTYSTLRDGWCYSGDLGFVDDDGFLFIVDRKKDMIVSGGENIYAREVEDALLDHSGVSEAAVIGIPDDKWGESVCAYVVPGSPPPTEIELIEHCRAKIASYKKPRRVVFMSELPKLASGKVDKKMLRAARRDPGAPAN